MTILQSAASRKGLSRWAATVIGAVGIALWATETALVSFTAGLPTFEIVALAFAAAALLSPLAWRITGESVSLAFRQSLSVWLITVPSLVCYHACIYFAVHRVPAAPAALLQGCTPLFIVLGSAFLPGQRLRWWHIAGVIGGLEGVISLSMEGGGIAAFSVDTSAFLALIGLAAGLWGIYSLISSRLGSVPTSAMGVFYGASCLIALLCHGMFEQWVTPTLTQAMAIAGLGLLPMGLALYCWDFGLKKGDVQALGVASYVEPLIGAGLVAIFGQGELHWSMMLSGAVIIGGAVLGSANFLEEGRPAEAEESGEHTAGTRAVEGTRAPAGATTYGTEVRIEMHTASRTAPSERFGRPPTFSASRNTFRHGSNCNDEAELRTSLHNFLHRLERIADVLEDRAVEKHAGRRVTLRRA